MELPARIRVTGALEGEFNVIEEHSASEFVIARETSWKMMLGEDEWDANAGEITAVEAEHGPFVSADGEG